MPNGGIFLIQNDETLLEMTEQKYDSEDFLQGLLEKYPNLLAGDQIDSEVPRKWLLVSREFEIPDNETSGGRWSIDHLFLDQDGIPTLVEVKRSSDTRIRREVIGQMLDYAANAVVYWPVESIVAKLEAKCHSMEINLDQLIQKAMGSECDPDEFWAKVKTNIKAGRIRMLFVADEIPRELRRVVEFLNEQMDPAEVLAVEIRQYLGGGLKTLVPRIIGQTQEAKDKKSVASGKNWDEPSFFDDLIKRRGAQEAEIARHIWEWAKDHKTGIQWGRGRQTGSFTPVLNSSNNQPYQLFAVQSSGYIQINFGTYKNRIEFEDPLKRHALREKFNEIKGVVIPEEAVTRYPNIPLAILKDEMELNRFFKTYEWFLEVIE